jgi:hypothetical protein
LAHEKLRQLAELHINQIAVIIFAPAINIDSSKPPVVLFSLSEQAEFS